MGKHFFFIYSVHIVLVRRDIRHKNYSMETLPLKMRDKNILLYSFKTLAILIQKCLAFLNSVNPGKTAPLSTLSLSALITTLDFHLKKTSTLSK